MASSSKMPPSTPPPRTSSLHFSAAIDLFTPDRKEELNRLKRRASQLSESAPKTPDLYLVWKKKSLESEIAVQRHIQESARESFRSKGGMDRASYESLRSSASDEQYKLEEELKQIVSQLPFLEQDMNDSFDAEGALIQVLYRECRFASGEGQKDPDLKRPKMSTRNKFKSEVEAFLEGTKGSGDAKLRFCAVTGDWHEADRVTCAHIVPHSLDSNHLAHLFGAGDAALLNKRNGLLLYSAIEKAYDNFSLTIVPYEPFVFGKPTEWKVVILDPKIINNVYFRGKDLG